MEANNLKTCAVISYNGIETTQQLHDLNLFVVSKTGN